MRLINKTGDGQSQFDYKHFDPVAIDDSLVLLQFWNYCLSVAYPEIIYLILNKTKQMKLVSMVSHQLWNWNVEFFRSAFLSNSLQVSSLNPAFCLFRLFRLWPWWIWKRFLASQTVSFVSNQDSLSSVTCNSQSSVKKDSIVHGFKRT